MKTLSSRFIKLNVILPTPGNPMKEVFLDAYVIESFGPCSDEYIKIGASTQVDSRNSNYRYYVTNSVEEIQEQLQQLPAALE